jgi:hypothetical protein
MLDDRHTNRPVSTVELKTLRDYLREGWGRARRNRPVSFYLLLAIPLELLMGTQMLSVRDNPKMFWAFLAMNFVFFFFVIVRALLDFTELLRRHIKEKESVFKTTLGDKEFLADLRERGKAGRRVP